MSTNHWVEARPRSARRHSVVVLQQDEGPLHAVRAAELTSLWRPAAA
ncbi:hypothetical protein [Streptomyces iakyrus]